MALSIALGRTVTWLLSLWWLVTLFILLVITVLSLWPADSMPSVPGGDRLHHCVAYALLAFPAAFARPKYWQWLIVVCVAWGGMIEIIQPYLNRYGEWWDFIANGLGVCLGLLLAHLVRSREEK